MHTYSILLHQRVTSTSKLYCDFSNRAVQTEPVTTPKATKRLALRQTYCGFDILGATVECEARRDTTSTENIERLQFTGQLYGHLADNDEVITALGPCRDVKRKCKKNRDHWFGLAMGLEQSEQGVNMSDV